MIQPEDFLHELTTAGIGFYTGVPDSLLKGLITTIETAHKNQHFTAVNEGAAIGLAAGYHLATGKVPVVYLQNSGLGNMINPLTSLADREVYGIPLLCIIGWRGEPGVKDEPQHVFMGRITPSLLNQLHIPFIVLKKDDEQEWRASVKEAIELCAKETRPVALLVESGVFPEEELEPKNGYELSAEEAIGILYTKLNKEDIVICTTGKIGRAFYRINSEKKIISKYFLNVGSMGHAISIATGLAMQVKERVILFDGDGALLMHMGALALPPSLQLKNLVYVLLNNGAHQSVGSQPSLGFEVDFCTIASGCGFVNATMVERKESLAALGIFLNEIDFLEIRINTKSSEPMPRPQQSPREAKEAFMKAIGAGKMNV